MQPTRGLLKLTLLAIVESLAAEPWLWATMTLYHQKSMRLLVACAVGALCVNIAVPRCASAQETRVAVIPLVLSDTADGRLVAALSEALGQSQPHARISTKRELDATLIIEGADTLSSRDLRELGHLMNVHVVVGVHRCDGATACVRVIADRIWMPSSPDTLRLLGAGWVQAATDTLALRFFRRPTARQHERLPDCRCT